MEPSTSMRVGGACRVGGWSVDPETCRISRGAEEHRLRPMLMDLLVLLAENAGRVVAKEQILGRVWQGRFVSESTLTSNVAELRRLLGAGQGRSGGIETISKHGYRLLAPVELGLPEPARLAVLPFDNLERDPEEDYFADGITDALITELGKIAGLRVISRHSVLHFRGSQKSLSEIARELKVDAMVEGSALHAGKRVRITAQLIQAEPERHLWAESYEFDLSDVLAVQARAARAIAGSVQAVLTPKEPEERCRARPVNPDAHVAYLKARYHWGKWTRAGVQKALACLQQTLDIDPTYAPAYECLALCMGVLGYWGYLPPQEAYPKARAAVLTALELDDSLSNAHAILGVVKWFLEWDLDGCERELRRAIELNASSEYAHFWHGEFLLLIRRDRSRALEEVRLALDLDPLSVPTNFCVAWFLLFAGEYERAAEQARKTLELYPDAHHAYYVLGWVHTAGSRYAEALAAFEKAAAISRDVISLAYLAHGHGRAGQRSAAQALLAELLESRPREHVPEFSLALVHAGLGDLDRAFESFERCYEERDSRLFWLPFVPCFEPLRSDPRYDDLLRRMGRAA